MTTDTDIVNRSLSEIGGRVTVANLWMDTTTAAVNARLHYTPLRQQLVRTAPWGFTRKTIAAALLGTLAAGTSPFPWNFKYAYPSDCHKMRYILPPPPPSSVNAAPVLTGVPVMLAPWSGPRRDWHYTIANDDSSGTDTLVILSNVDQALLVYNKDVIDPDIWDSLFSNAMVMALANKLVIPITGNAGMKGTYSQLCDKAIIEARIPDANETVHTTDHEASWIVGRGSYMRVVPTVPFTLGQYDASWESMNWGA